ncbi:MAG: hypothetical protein Q4G34_01155 [Micrococcus sp.]|nr:hypothetical protein [Micrococcus sp.]
MHPSARRTLTIATAVALLAAPGIASSAAAEPVTAPADAVTVIIPVTEDAITVTVTRNPAAADAARTTPIVQPRPPAPRPETEPAAPEQPVQQPAPVQPQPVATDDPAAAPTSPPPVEPAAPEAPVTVTVTETITPQDPPGPATDGAVPARPPIVEDAPTITPTLPLPTVDPESTPRGDDAPAPEQGPTAPPEQPTDAAPEEQAPTEAAPEAPEPTQTTVETLTPTPTETGVEGDGAAPRAEREEPTPGTPVTVTPSEDGLASGMPWRSGVFAHSLDRVQRYEQKTGRPVDTLAVAPSRGSWATIMDPWWMDRPSEFTGTLDVAVPLWQGDGSLSAAAGGADVEHWEALGRLIESQYPGSTVRIGWEFNLGGWPHHATDANVEEWKQAFRHASVALKRGGPSLLVTWNPNKGRGDSLGDASKAWPGDDVVDIVAIDAYDWWPAYNESTWPEHRDGDQGWQYWVDFARAHGKKFGVPEWGVAPGNDHGGGDNPFFIETVTDFLAQENARDGIVHHAYYFDEPMDYIRNSIGDGQVPQAGQALAQAMTEIAAGQSQSTAAPEPAATSAPTETAAPQPTTEAAPEPTPMTTSAPPDPAPTDTDTQAPVPVELDPPPAADATGAGAWQAPDSGDHGPTPPG